MYTVVAGGDTSCVPSSETVPTPWLMVTVSAFSTTHSSVEVWPLLMVGGIAEKRMMRGSVPGVTVTATLQESVLAPPAPVAVIV